MGEHADAVAELQHEIRTRQEVGIAAADLDEDGRLLPRQVEIAKCSAHHRRAGSKWKASYSDPLLRRLNAAPDTLLVVCRKHSAGVRTKAGPRHFCPKLTSALFAISVHKSAILAPDVLALPSRSHNRAFLRSHVPWIVWGGSWLSTCNWYTKRGLPGRNISSIYSGRSVIRSPGALSNKALRRLIPAR
jgi:hypothetical protein